MLEETVSCDDCSNDGKSMWIQNLTADVAEVANGLGRDGLEQIESTDIQELLDSQVEMLTPHSLKKRLDNI